MKKSPELRLIAFPYHDGVRFTNGGLLALQDLGPGVKAHVIDAFLSPRWVPELAHAL